MFSVKIVRLLLKIVLLSIPILLLYLYIAFIVSVAQ